MSSWCIWRAQPSSKAPADLNEVKQVLEKQKNLSSGPLDLGNINDKVRAQLHEMVNASTKHYCFTASHVYLP